MPCLIITNAPASQIEIYMPHFPSLFFLLLTSQNEQLKQQEKEHKQNVNKLQSEMKTKREEMHRMESQLSQIQENLKSHELQHNKYQALVQEYHASKDEYQKLKRELMLGQQTLKDIVLNVSEGEIKLKVLAGDQESLHKHLAHISSMIQTK